MAQPRTVATQSWYPCLKVCEGNLQQHPACEFFSHTHFNSCYCSVTYNALVPSSRCIFLIFALLHLSLEIWSLRAPLGSHWQPPMELRWWREKTHLCSSHQHLKRWEKLSSCLWVGRTESHVVGAFSPSVWSPSQEDFPCNRQVDREENIE